MHIVFGEYLNQLAGGLPMSQGELCVRPTWASTTRCRDLTVPTSPISANRATPARGAQVAQLLAQLVTPEADAGLDETHLMIRDQFRRFAEEKGRTARAWLAS